MITPEQRGKLETKWSSDDRSIASLARRLKATVLTLFVLGLAWIGASGENPNNAQLASMITAAPTAPHQADEGSAVRAAR